MNIDKLKPYVPLILRVGLALVFLFFAIDKFMNRQANIAEFELLPVPHFLSISTEVLLIGILEGVIAILLFLGIGSRWVGFFSAGYIALIMLMLGITNVSRDIGLVAMAFAIGILGHSSSTGRSSKSG